MNASPRWRKSTHSSGDGDCDCVEIADLNDHIGIRDSRNPSAGHLPLTRQNFAVLLIHLASQTS